MQSTRVLGLAGWSGSGKTTLLVRLIPVLVARGLRIATLKHAHHAFDVDTPGKDSYEHRKAGACEVIVSSARRWVQMHEVEGGAEATLGELLRRVSPCDLVLVEGFKGEALPKMEIYRAAVGKPAFYLGDRFVHAVATDGPLAGEHPPTVHLNDVEAVADAVLRLAQPLQHVLEELAKPAPRAAVTPA